MLEVKSLAEWIAARGMTVAALAEAVALDKRVVQAIAAQRYTSSPEQRQALADALQVEPGQIAWGGSVPVAHIYGHGPQFGRSP